MNTTPIGFLVVLKTPEYQSERSKLFNPRYLGVDRIPTYPSPGYPFDYPEEADALDEYVFGDVKSEETNLIPDLATALKLLTKFSSSPRDFDVILCSTGPNDVIFKTLMSDKFVVLGYDVLGVTPLGYDVAAVKGDSWSIVYDFAAGDWAKPFLTCLNQYGLFRERSDAEEYYRGYREHNEPGADCPFDIVYVANIIEKRKSGKSGTFRVP